MAKGKKSMRSIVEETFKKSIWDVFSEMNVKTVEDAQARLLVQGKITTSTVTIIRTIQTGVELGEIKEDANFLCWLPFESEEQKKKGRASVRDLIEHITGVNIWDLFRTKFADISNADDAAKRLVSLSKDKVPCTGQTVIKTVMRGLEKKEITENEFFYAWCPIVKHHRKTKDHKVKTVKEDDEVSSGPKRSMVTVQFQCTCGKAFAAKSEVWDGYFLGLKARQCPSCNKIGSLSASFSVNGKQYRKAVIELPKMNISGSEEFVDEHNKKTKNPFYA